MKIELFYAAGCIKCANNRENLKTAAQRAFADVTWLELDVMENIDYAADLGVLTLPALAIDGVLEFPALPNEQQLVHAIHRRLNAQKRG